MFCDQYVKYLINNLFGPQTFMALWWNYKK